MQWFWRVSLGVLVIAGAFGSTPQPVYEVRMLSVACDVRAGEDCQNGGSTLVGEHQKVHFVVRRVL